MSNFKPKISRITPEGLFKNPQLIQYLTKEQKKQLKEETLAGIKKLNDTIKETKEKDPFWFYEPSDGTITDEGRELLERYLKPDDIPIGKLQGQLDFHLSKAPVRMVIGGNQSGKTTSAVIDNYIEGLGVLPFSMQDVYPKEKLSTKRPYAIRVISVDHTTLLNTVLPRYQYWCPRDYLINGKWDNSYKEESKEGQRLLKLGDWKQDKLICTIEFMTNEMKVQKFQGPALDKVSYDEEPREDIYKENLLRFTTADAINIVFSFTPTNGLSWATDMVESGADNIEVFQICSVTNKSANLKVLSEIIDLITDYNEKKMRLLGEIISLSGLVYGKLFSPNLHVIKPFYVNPKDYVVQLGLDPHLVTNTAAVFLAIDRENNKYVIYSYFKQSDTEEIKKDINEIFALNKWRWGWSVADRSSDTNIMAFGGRNIFKELRRQPYGLKSLRTSEKYEGSIKAGVDEIKQHLKPFPTTGKPRLYIFDIPENKPLIQSFRTLQRDSYVNESKKGMKDAIMEGKHHLHAALRYIFQYPLSWYPETQEIPQADYQDAGALW